MLMLDFSTQNMHALAEAEALSKLDELQLHEPSAEIEMHLECDGKKYYAWSIQYQYGMSCSLIDAIAELLQHAQTNYCKSSA